MVSSGGVIASAKPKCSSEEPMRFAHRKKKEFVSPTLEGGGWKCIRCKNINFREKLFCNMRKCQSPRPLEPWTCKDCGHEEPNPLAPRCSECSAVRPLTREDCIVIHAHATGDIPLQFQPHSLTVQQFIKAPRGAWICSSCNNVNWPARTRCNGKNCYKSRGTDDLMHTEYVRELFKVTHESLGESTPAALQECAGDMADDVPEIELDNDDSTSGSVSPSCASVKVADRLSSQQRLADLVRTLFTETMPWNSPVAQDSLPGSWICMCGKVNWPSRHSCDRPECSIPRPFIAPLDA
ncbi:hypothetical protein FOL47_002487 [Perkinsus chesapeaki]|uniref:RanBP2-type domain-containing protein n=1 Tax=Perkinsus chesapeaki TaxID=330153 RepID=A0A7J6N039_PERCH|nr:hypothetical protein FOL47_002487 [Perkinsus chesapeaki]